MKKILIAAALLAAVACGETEPKFLVLYYSQTGTTKAVADALQQQLGADVEEIVPVVSYGDDYGATIARGRQEFSEGILPEIQPIQADLSQYDYIFLGYPIWFGTYANPIGTVLDQLDFAGKTVIPFCTFGSGGLETSFSDIVKKIPDATVLPGYGVRSARIDAVPAEVERFLKGYGFIPGEADEFVPFPDEKDVTPEEAAIFDEAVGTYPMIHAKAAQVSSRPVPGGTEYKFAAEDILPEDAPEGIIPAKTWVYVLVEDGKAPVFTRVVR